MGKQEFNLSNFLKQTDPSKNPTPYNFNPKAILRNVLYFLIIFAAGFLFFGLSYVIGKYYLPDLISDPDKRWRWDYGIFFVLGELFVLFWLIFTCLIFSKWENHINKYEQNLLSELME